MSKATIKDLDLKGKRVFIRVDFNVPVKNGVVTDDNRIVSALPTINYALEKGAKIILASHRGRPKGEGFEEDYSMKPVFLRLKSEFGDNVFYSEKVIGEEVVKKSQELKEGQILLIENLRFEKGEKKSDPEFAKELRKLSDLYVNDAFGTCHRKDASVYVLPTLYEKPVAGFLVEKEIHYFENVLANPEKPYIAILGGAKVSDKIPVIENLLNKVDSILIGGAMAYTFLKAKGVEIGKSILEMEMVELAEQYMNKAKEKGIDIFLPVDHVITDKIEDGKVEITLDEKIPEGFMGVDIGPETIVKFKEVIKGAKTVVWNGPMGIFEIDSFSAGTIAIANAIAESECVSIVGGGDSAAAVKKAGVFDKISHVSTGGGASLEYLAGKKLPGIEVLSDK
ncbi:phosphoglycerate kinase [Thermotomaculum hydrothermale]|uniref:Phosphoglycerate kinase n=1 Tax=Thermotomaculum hydrothermale TaxID=981385 RepID=A0A7R6SZM7_9BACT|nr:phosphoglycerate kinase [Thermotomaculum hydrothermale]BBB32985.1 phosphoglycerate kinase [Thermotomaculum hydrothermale]